MRRLLMGTLFFIVGWPSAWSGGLGGWDFLGPEVGRPRDLAVDHQDPNLILASGGNGIFRSADGGLHWTRSVEGLTHSVVEKASFDPGAPGRAFATTIGGGVFRSLDGGVTWDAANQGLTSLNVTSLVIDPVDPIILVGTFDGVFRSQDGGSSWAPSNQGLTLSRVVVGIAIAPSDHRVIYLATNGGGIYRSQDSGASWTFASDGLPLTPDGEIAVHPQDPNLVVAGTVGDGQYLTRDGQSWLFVSFRDEGQLVFDPLRPSGFVIASDGGADFIDLQDPSSNARDPRLRWPGNGLIRMAISPSNPNVRYAATELGTLRSEDAGETWTSIDQGLRMAEVRSVAIDPTLPIRMLMGTNAGVQASIDAGRSWDFSRPFRRPARAVEVSPTDPLFFVAALGDDLVRSENGGATWRASGQTISQVVRGVLRSPDSPDDLWAWAGNPNSLLASADGGRNWFISTFFPPGMTPRALAIVHSASDVRFLATADGLLRTVDGGVTWEPATDLEGLDVHDVVIDPSDSAKVYAGTSAGVFRSTDQGLTWTQDPEGLLFGLLVRTLVIDPDDPSRVWAAAWGDGVFVSLDHGASWTPEATQPENLFIWELSFDSTFKRLLAASLGGLWSMSTEEDIFASFLGVRLSQTGRASSATDVNYVVEVTNSGSEGQPAQPAARLLVALPSRLAAIESDADAGRSQIGPGNQIVVWSGALPTDQTVRINVKARVRAGLIGKNIALQAFLQLDSQGDGTLDAMAVGQATDDAGSPALVEFEDSSIEFGLQAVPHTLPIPESFVGVALVNRERVPQTPQLLALAGDGTIQGQTDREEILNEGQQAFISVEAFEDPVETLGIRGDLKGFFLLGSLDQKRLDGIGDRLAEEELLYFPEVEEGPDAATFLYLFNPDAERAAQVSLRLFSQAGELQGQRELSLPSFGSDISRVGPSFGLGALEGGYLRAESDGPIRGFVLLETGETVTTLPGVPFVFSDRLSAPHFFWNALEGETEVRLLNPGNEVLRVGLTLVTDPIALPADAGGSGEPDESDRILGPFPIEIEAGAVATLNLRDLVGAAASDERQGWLEVMVERPELGVGALQANTPIIGTVTYDGGVLNTRSSLPLIDSPVRDLLFLQVAHSAELAFFQGLALVNTSDSPAFVLIRAFDFEGTDDSLQSFLPGDPSNETGVTVIFLAPGERFIGLLDSPLLFGEGFDQVRGHIEVDSNAPISVYSLFGGAESLSAIQGTPDN